MKNYIYGYKSPLFEIRANVSSAPIYIYLSFKIGGVTEYHEDKFIEHVALGGDRLQKYLYTNITFELDYSEFIEAADLLSIQSVLDYEKLGWIVRMYPNSEFTSRSYIVHTVKEPHSIRILPGGANSPGHSGLIIKFITAEPQTSEIDTEGDVILAEDLFLSSLRKIYLVGDATTPGSWRMEATLGGNLAFECYDGAAWIEESAITP